MRTFLISYDLAAPTSRHALSAEIMQLGEAWARPLEATWYVRTKERQGAIEARMRPLLEGDDGLLIQEVAGDAAMLNTTLRWFRRRRVEASESCNIVAFPSPQVAPAAPEAEAA